MSALGINWADGVWSTPAWHVPIWAQSGEPSDTTPDQFSFIDQTGVALSSTITSAAIVVTGINSAASISVSGGTYSINGGSYTASAGTVNNGDSVAVRHTSSVNYATQTSTILTIGGVSDTFTSETLPDPAVTGGIVVVIRRRRR